MKKIKYLHLKMNSPTSRVWSLWPALISWFFILLSGAAFSQDTPPSQSICDDPNYPHNAIWQKYCGGGAQSQSSGFSPEQIQQNQNIADAGVLNQQGLASMNQKDYDSALKYFQQALEKTPDDSGIQQNLKNAQSKVEARNKFKQDQNDALGDMRDISNGGDFDSGHTANNGSQNDSGFRDIDVSGNSGGKSSSSVNTDPKVVDLRGITRLGIDPARLKEKSAAEADQLVQNPNYTAAEDKELASYRSKDAREEHKAIETIRRLEEIIVLPEKKDIEFLFNDPSRVTDEQIINGIALPTQDSELDQILADHPELKAELLALWYKTCAWRKKTEDKMLAASARQLGGVADRLKLPYGHMEETAEKNPEIYAQWKAARRQIADTNQFYEVEAACYANDWFNRQTQQLVKDYDPNEDPIFH